MRTPHRFAETRGAEWDSTAGRQNEKDTGWVLRGSRRYRAGSLCLTCRLVVVVLWVTRYAIFARCANANSATFVALFDLIHEAPKRKKKKQDKCPASLFLVTRGRIELPFQPWEGRVLAAWPTSHLSFARLFYHSFFRLSRLFHKLFLFIIDFTDFLW